MSRESQELAQQLNAFYRDQYRRTMKWVVLMITICVILTVILTWMTYHRVQPQYYAAMTNGTVVPMHSLSEPVITNNFITEWSALTARLIYNLNFDEYQKQLGAIRNRFTTDGWSSMMTALQASGYISNLVNNRLIVSAVVSGPPVILARMVVDGRFTWRVQMVLLITYTSASATVKNQLRVTMNIQRVPTLDASQGIQIMDFHSQPAQP